MQRLKIMVGLPGSGKTTFAKNWVNEQPLSRIRICRNDIRKMLGPTTVITNQREALISVIESTGVRNALKGGYDVVIDAHHLNPKVINKWVNYANMVNKKPDVELELDFVKLTTDLPTCIARDASKPGDESVGKDVIVKLYNKYLAPKPTVHDGGRAEGIIKEEIPPEAGRLMLKKPTAIRDVEKQIFSEDILEKLHGKEFIGVTDGQPFTKEPTEEDMEW